MDAPNDLDLHSSEIAGHGVLRVRGEVDLGTANALGDRALALLQTTSAHLVLDLSGVTFMDSTGLKVLIAIQRRAALAGGSLAVAGATRPVHRLLTITGLDEAFTLVDSVEQALASSPASAGSGGRPPEPAPPVSADAEPTA